MPPADARDAIVGALIGQLLDDGSAARLNQVLVRQKKVATEVSGGLNWPLGSPFAYGGPTLLTTLINYPAEVSADTVLSAHDAAIAELRAKGVSAVELERTRTKMLADWYGELERPVDRATALAHAVLFFGSTDRVMQLGGQLAGVTSADVQAFVAKYLVPANRTVIVRNPAAGAATRSTGGK